MEREGSIGLLIARFVTKLVEDGRKLGVHFLSIRSIKFGGRSVLSNVRGRRALEKKSRLGNKLVNVFNQDVLQSSQHFRHYLLFISIRLFVKKTASASRTTGSLWRKNRTGTSGTLLATTRAVSSSMSLADKMQQGSVITTQQKQSRS
jgi:hypothetical protein